MKCTLVGSRFFGATVFEALRNDGAEIARVVAPAADDRLALAALGLDLLTRVVRHARQHGEVPAHPQDERFATKAPMIRRTVSLTDEGKSPITSLVATVTGPDRPGIVSLLSERAQGFGANWAGSRIATLAGQFAGLVHFEVPPQ